MLHLEQALQLHTEESLHTIGGNLGLWKAPPTDSKGDLIKRIADAIRHNVDWRALGPKLSLEERMCLLSLLVWPSSMPPKEEDTIKAAAILSMHADPESKTDVAKLTKRIEDALKALHSLGIAYYIERHDGRHLVHEYLDNPSAQMNALYRRASWAGIWQCDGFTAALIPSAELFTSLHPEITRALSVTGNPVTVRNDGPTALYDLVQLACTARNPGLRVTQKGPLYKKDRDLLEARLLIHDNLTVYSGFLGLNYEQTPLRHQFLLAWATALGLITGEDSTIVPGPTVDQWMRLSPEEQQLSLLELWRAYQAPLAPGMPFILCALVTAPPDQWLDLSHLLAALARIQHMIATNMRVYTPYGHSGGVMRESLAALVYIGASEIGLGTISTPTESPLGLLLSQGRLEPGKILIRLTPSGRQALVDHALTDYPLHDHNQNHLIVQPNFEVVVRPYAPPGLHWSLAMVADLVRPDQAYVYRITRESIIRALRAGWTEAHLLSFLQTGTAAQKPATTTPIGTTAPPALPLPQNVLYSIRNWSSGYGRCTVIRLAVVQCESPELADRLITEGALQNYTLGRVSPTAVLVRDDALKKVIALLEKAGLPPPADPVYIVDRTTAERHGMGLITPTEQNV